MAKVSIIIPTYNVEMYLEECMDSVIHQTLKDIEIICINDGSTDNSLYILEQYANRDDRIIIINKENGGYGIAMNIGLEKATGEYIGIVEPDDFVSATMFEELYLKAMENDLDFVKADFYRFKRNETGDMELVYNHLSKNPEDYNQIFNPSVTPEAMCFIMNTWSGIYRRSFLEEYHICHNETPGASFQDNGFWFQTFVFAKRAMILDKPYYMNRRDNPNSSVFSSQKVYCMNVEYDHIRDIIMEYPELWERFRGMYWYKKFYNYMGTLRRIEDEFKEEYILRFSAEFQRGFALGEIDETVFSENTWKKIELLISHPRLYYQTKILPPIREQKLKLRIDKLKEKNQELSFRVERLENKNQKLLLRIDKLEKKEKKLSQEIKHIRESISYRIGRILTYFPRKIKQFFSRNS